MCRRKTNSWILIVRALIVSAVLGTCAIGCGKKGPKLHPVQGKVTFEGAAPDGAVVVFQPVDAHAGATMPSGAVGSDGRFKLTTYPHGDGAPEGEYIVLISWLPPEARSSDNPKNRLPGRYADATQPVFRATVKAGKNELEPFVLTK
jgi:hypothetical protein